MSLVSSAHRNDLDVWAYVKDVLDKLLSGGTDYASLRPDIWKLSHPESIRTYRDEERRQTAARRDRTRLERRFARLKQNARRLRTDDPRQRMVLVGAYRWPAAVL